jgi:hypothetical protein
MTTRKTIVYGLLAVIFTLTFTALSFTGCSGTGGGGKSLNSATELKEYLDKQPANSPDNPIKVAMKVNDMMFEDIVKVINDAGKYVSLDLSGSPLTTIPERAFYECEALASITIPNSVISIGAGAFSECTSLASITIPNSVISIGTYAFWSCESLISVIIPNSVTEIRQRAFCYCPSLTSITIPASVEYVGAYAFDLWTASQTINIQGKANRGATIAAGWEGSWDDCDAQINYLGQ